MSTWDPVTARRTHVGRVGDATVTDLDVLGGGSVLVADAAGRVQQVDARLAPRGSPVDLGADTCCLAPGPRAGTAVVFSDPSRAP